MTASIPPIIHIAAALIDDGQGRLLLVRKVGTKYFMQAGGKIEPGETALLALKRELHEEIGLSLDINHPAHYLGWFSAPAANEQNHMVQAELYHIRLAFVPIISAEIEEAVWVTPGEAAALTLAPLTRDYILNLSISL